MTIYTNTIARLKRMHDRVDEDARQQWLNLAKLIREEEEEARIRTRFIKHATERLEELETKREACLFAIDTMTDVEERGVPYHGLRFLAGKIGYAPTDEARDVYLGTILELINTVEDQAKRPAPAEGAIFNDEWWR